MLMEERMMAREAGRQTCYKAGCARALARARARPASLLCFIAQAPTSNPGSSFAWAAPALRPVLSLCCCQSPESHHRYTIIVDG